MSKIFYLLVLLAIWLPTGAGANITKMEYRPSILVSLEAPAGRLKMGDVPAFVGRITNKGYKKISGIIVYLSLVSLHTGNEHPVDLEDWSAQKAIRIDHLAPGETNQQQWSMRLIKSGRFGAALTVVDPKRNKPLISPLALFDIAPKPTVISSRILPVTFGMPLLLAGIFILVYRKRR